MNNLLDKCAECGEEFYSTHLDKCSKEEDIEMCGMCDKFYHNKGKSIANECKCEREGE